MPSPIDAARSVSPTSATPAPTAAGSPSPRVRMRAATPAEAAPPAPHAGRDIDAARGTGPLSPPARPAANATSTLLQLEDAVHIFDHDAAALPPLRNQTRQQAQLWPHAAVSSPGQRAQRRAEDQARFVIPLALRRWGKGPGEAASMMAPPADGDGLQRLLGILRLDTAVAAHDYADSPESDAFWQWRRDLARRRRRARQRRGT